MLFRSALLQQATVQLGLEQCFFHSPEEKLHLFEEGRLLWFFSFLIKTGLHVVSIG
jgi:hypothetical protein